MESGVLNCLSDHRHTEIMNMENVPLTDEATFDATNHMNFEIKLQLSDFACSNNTNNQDNTIMLNGQSNTEGITDGHPEESEQKTDHSTTKNGVHDLNSNDGAAKPAVVLSESHCDSDDTGTSADSSTDGEYIPMENATIKAASESQPAELQLSHENHNELSLSSFTFTDGTVVNLNESLQQNPSIVEAQRLLNVFLSKVTSDATLCDMVGNTMEYDKIINELEKELNDLGQKCKHLECQNLELQHSMKQSEEKLSTHDLAAKRTIARLHSDSENKIKELNKKCSAAENEKQASVMSYARREKELLDLRRQKEGAEQFARNAGKERDKVLGQLKSLKADLSKIKNAHEKKESESSVHNKEMDKLKEEINSQIIKVRWAQNKLKSEVDSHKETKEKCEKMVFEIQHAKEETEQIRKNCQEMIKTYQESEEIQSNALDIELKEKVQLLAEKQTEVNEVRSILKQRNEELSLLKIKHKDVFEEHQVLKSKAETLEEERMKSQRVMREYEEVMNKQKLNASQMNEKMQNIFDLQSQVEELNLTIDELNENLEEAHDKRDAALNDLTWKNSKEQELLEFTEKVSSKNSQLTVEAEELNSKLSTQNDELHSYEKQIAALQNKVDELTSTHEKESVQNLKSQTISNKRLDEKEQTICQLLLQLEELKDEMRTVKRKNTASVKDLTRQLNQVKKKIDNVDSYSTSSAPNSLHHSADGGSMGSRTSSSTSLDKIASYSPDGNGGSNTMSAYEPAVSVPETTVAGPDTFERQMLIERIVRLQQIHAKKNEKIDFLSEHVQQLVSALQKKQRLIQHYIMREESGALAPPRQNNDHHRSKSGLTLDLSMEINQKMQSVLEDTLLKNITLKESLEMLGKEIQRLSAQTDRKPS